MKIEDLEAKIVIKANRTVQEDLRLFKREVTKARDRLVRDNYLDYTKIMEIHAAHAASLAGGKDVWPSWLWRNEEERVRKDIMSTMDTLQQVLLEQPAPVDGEGPLPEKENEGKTEG